MPFLVRNLTKGEVLGDRIHSARSSTERRRGLLGRAALLPGEGLFLTPCEAVHTFGMQFPIDVLHLDRARRVKRIRPSLKPNRISISLTSRSVLELPSGTAARTGTAPGDTLSFTKWAALALLLFASTGCVKRPFALTPPTTEFRNATDAGPGNFVLARLREKVIEAPADLAFRLELAAAYEASGSPELALDHYRLAVAYAPQAAEPRLLQARTLTALGHPAEALRGYAAFLAAHPDAEPRYFSWLGILQDSAGDQKSGEAAHRRALSRALALHQDRDYLHNNLGFCLLSQQRLAEAAEQFRAALVLNPHSEIARDNLAAALPAGKREALVHLQSLHGPAAAHNNLAALALERGDYAAARSELALALSFDRTAPATLRNLEILSQLEGKPATLPGDASLSAFSRAKIAMGRLFRSQPRGAQTPAPDQTVSTATIEAASRTKDLPQ